MSNKQFRFSCTLKDHDADVRGLCISVQEKGGILSCSRDKTTKLWIPDTDSCRYNSKSSYIGHKKFVSCVVTMDPIKGIYPDGLILTGSNDKTINVYLPFDEIAIISLEGHNNVISNLKCGMQGEFYSSSWDQTVRVWKLDLSNFGVGKCIKVLSGHQAAVWDVALVPESEQLLSASADKTICLWNNESIICTYKGHTDCVRGLSVISALQFLSCSNDSTVKRWGIGGECLQTYYGHKNFVYSLDVLPNLEMFVSSGEDQTIKVWNFSSSNPIQTLPVPALSAWKVIVLLNEDLAVGCSDGSVRIFTSSDDRVASEDEKLIYEEELSKLALPEEGLNLGNIDSDKLRGPEALQESGHKDGQTLLVRNGAIVEAYQWSAVEIKWVKVGDVVGSKGSNKSTYKGKEYDFVFTVDILEGAPPLHLPYNLSEDPWFAAQKFIDDNDLSQQFLETVANFIIDNTKQSVPMEQDNNFTDPFTGQGRYQPNDDNAKPQDGYDPFTGGGRYVPDSSTNGHSTNHGSTRKSDPMVSPSRYIPSEASEKLKNKTNSSISINKYFPKFGYIFFESQNHVSMFKKLFENSQISNKPLSSEDLEVLKLLLHTPVQNSIPPNAVELLWTILAWDSSLVLPVLDLLRCIFICHSKFFELAFKSESKKFLILILGHLQTDSLIVNKLLAVRILCNLFTSSFAISFLFDSFPLLVESIKKFLQSGTEVNNNLFVAFSTLLVNFAVSFNSTETFSDEVEEMRLSCIDLCAIYLVKVSKINAEAYFRLLVALGTFLYGHEQAQVKAQSANIKQLVLSSAPKFSDSSKVAECSNLVVSML